MQRGAQVLCSGKFIKTENKQQKQDQTSERDQQSVQVCRVETIDVIRGFSQVVKQSADNDESDDLILFGNIDGDGLCEVVNKGIDLIEQDDRERGIDSREQVGNGLEIVGVLLMASSGIHDQDDEAVHQKKEDGGYKHHTLHVLLGAPGEKNAVYAIDACGYHDTIFFVGVIQEGVSNVSVQPVAVASQGTTRNPRLWMNPFRRSAKLADRLLTLPSVCYFSCCRALRMPASTIGSMTIYPCSSGCTPS